MNCINAIVTRVHNKINSDRTSRFRYKFTCKIPEILLENVAYIISEGDIPDTVVFKCPCGCGSTIFLNLLPDAKPRWNYEISLKGCILYTLQLGEEWSVKAIL